MATGIEYVFTGLVRLFVLIVEHKSIRAFEANTENIFSAIIWQRRYVAVNSRGDYSRATVLKIQQNLSY